MVVSTFCRSSETVKEGKNVGESSTEREERQRVFVIIFKTSVASSCNFKTL